MPAASLRVPFRSLLALGLALFSCATAYSTTYYVSPSGTDSTTPGSGSAELPFRTLQFAADLSHALQYPGAV